MAHHQSVASETLFLLVLLQAPTLKRKECKNNLLRKILEKLEFQLHDAQDA